MDVSSDVLTKLTERWGPHPERRGNPQPGCRIVWQPAAMTIILERTVRFRDNHLVLLLWDDLHSFKDNE